MLVWRMGISVFYALDKPVPVPTEAVPQNKPTIYTKQFSLIDVIAASLPVQEAGLKEGYLVVQIRRINHTNHHKGLMALGGIIPEAASNGKGIPVIVL